MKIEFEIDVAGEKLRSKTVKIIGISESVEESKKFGMETLNRQEKEIGRIFTPSGSGSYIKNAIQVCGFDEVFSLWGCGLFGETKTKKPVYFTQEDLNAMPKDARAQFEHCFGPIVAGKTVKDIVTERRMKRDVQLLFSLSSNNERLQQVPRFDKQCFRCFSIPCSCDYPGAVQLIDGREVFLTGSMFFKSENDLKDKIEAVEKEE